MTSAAAIRESIVTDEIGIATAVLGPYRLKSVFQPIFSRSGGTLRLTGVQATAATLGNGRPIGSGADLAVATTREAAMAEPLSLALHLRNYANIGVAGLDLHVDCVSCPGVDLLSVLTTVPMAGWDDIVLGAEKLVCEIAPAQSRDYAFWQAIDDLRWKGVRLAGTFGAERKFPAEVVPDIVRIDGGWLGKIRTEATAQLLVPVISILRRRGAKILIDGIDTAGELQAAVEMDADLYQGSFLARSVPAGGVLDDAPLSLAGLLAGGSNVVALRG
ncbi:EAL domain-containing protein [Mesorhizobium sp. KR2-14]|uniref:EAL domain-containing protein n=1 Tax=Mesorhizobium sp. KR2-14 TaxID=3156610 RepID=UPI0032B314F6